jgi:hypothetical protein
MRRRANYGFERWQRETARRAKRESKREQREARAREGNSGPEIGEAPDTAAPAGVWEWFSPSRGRVTTSPPGARPESDPPDDWVLLTTPEPAGNDGPSAG